MIAAYIHASLPIGFLDTYFKEEEVIPYGVPIKPDTPLTPDEQLFPKCHRQLFNAILDAEKLSWFKVLDLIVWIKQPHSLWTKCDYLIQLD